MGGERANDFVTKIAKKQGFDPEKYKGDDSLKGAISHLEDKFGAPSDSVTDKFGGGLQHHLRDFAHHPTPVGLVFSMLTQFTKNAYGTDTQGVFQVVPVKNEKWIGKDVPQKFLFGTVFWFFHMVSDMAGSKATPGAGTGLPGPIGSLLKEVSSLPFFKKTVNANGNEVNEFSLWISKLFNGTLLAEHDENGKIIKDTVRRFDLRAEIGVGYELGRQAIPVILNECIVRGFYFIRRLVNEIKEKQVQNIKDLKLINWRNTLPFKNRTIVRMLTISTGTFTLFDLADAAIRGAINSGANSALFAKEFILRVNFVGVGRFAVAIATDVSMGIKLSKLRNERMGLNSEQLQLMNAKVFYLQADTWVAAETTAKTIAEAEKAMEQTIVIFANTVAELNDRLDNIGNHIDKIRGIEPTFIDEMKNTLMWG
jgi:hypothetical protein